MNRYHSAPQANYKSSQEKRGSFFKKNGPFQKSKFKRNEKPIDTEEFDPYCGAPTIPPETLKKYQRGSRMDFNGIRNKSQKIAIAKSDKKYRESARQAARSELLLTEDAGYIEPADNEDTFRIQQHELAAQVDITSASKLFSLLLTEFGPYKLNYSRDGRHLLLAGRRGHLASMDWVTKKLLSEVNVMESVHDICWLHLPTMFAAAQKNWVHIYDNKGVELHCIKKMHRILQMEFLPYHFLLTTASEKGFLSWLDISVGKMVKETYTSAGRLRIMCQNPYNAIVATGHPNGCVSMWSPNCDQPLRTILCHAHPVTSVAIDSKGLYMATASIDRSFKIYDVRMYNCLQTYRLGGAAGYLNFSQKGLLAVGLGNMVEVYKDCCTQAVTAPYMRHKVRSTIQGLQFCPYEDVLGIGYSSGFSSILIPGAGEPNFDAFESNPFMTKSQRREIEVKSLLEKIQPELITLNPGELGLVNVAGLKDNLEKMKSIPYVKPPKVDFEPRVKQKARSKSAQVFKRKKIVQETAKRDHIKSAIKDKEKAKHQKKDQKKGSVLDRFKSSVK